MTQTHFWVSWMQGFGRRDPEGKNHSSCQDSAPAYKGVLAIAKLRELRCELSKHLFPEFKRFLRGERFSSSEGVAAAVDEYFGGESLQRWGDEWENRWERCIELRGECTEE